MGVTKTHIPARFDANEVNHIDDVRFSCWPTMSRSQALRLIVMEHRLLTAAGIIGREPIARKENHCSQIHSVPSVEPRRVSEGQGTEGGKNFAQGGKSA